MERYFIKRSLFEDLVVKCFKFERRNVYINIRSLLNLIWGEFKYNYTEIRYDLFVNIEDEVRFLKAIKDKFMRCKGIKERFFVCFFVGEAYFSSFAVCI